MAAHVLGECRHLEPFACGRLESDLPFGEAAARRTGRLAVDRDVLDVAGVGDRAADATTLPSRMALVITVVGGMSSRKLDMPRNDALLPASSSRQRSPRLSGLWMSLTRISLVVIRRNPEPSMIERQIATSERNTSRPSTNTPVVPR